VTELAKNGTWRAVTGRRVEEAVGARRVVVSELECGHVTRGLIPEDKIATTTELPCRRCLEGSITSGTTCRKCGGVGKLIRWVFSRTFVETCDECAGEGAVVRRSV